MTSAKTTAAADAQAPVPRLLDANLDRAREGLRVLEDWARFGLERPDLVARCKDLRQRLGAVHHNRYKLARDTAGDPATGLAHPLQIDRRDPLAVVAANAARVQEALRVLEEFGRAVDPALAREAAGVRYALYDLEVAILRAGGATGGAAGGREDRGAARRQRLADCHLYLVTAEVEGLESVVAAALAAGLRLVQYRAKTLSDGQRLEQARRLRHLCADHGALFLVNDRIDLALAVDADGVHLGQDDLPPAVARRLLGPDRLIGRSTHGPAQLEQAVADGCDYVGVGPVHATPTKPGRPAVGLDCVRAATASPIPWFAIGGVDLGNLAAVRQAGAQRVAVVRALTDASDPAAATAALLAGLGVSA
ncbi:MAG: thiamine phosphate synthase [Synechococcaceae cyanobacterium]